MRAFILIFAVATTFHGSFSEARRKKGPKLQVPANQIMKLEGTARVNGQPATEFMGIKSGDEIETGDKSVAVIRVAGLGLFRITENSKLKLKEVGDRNNSVVELKSGQALALYRRLGNHTFILPKGKFMIKEKATFFAKADDVCLCNGSITTRSVPQTAQAAQANSPAPSPLPANAAVAAAPVVAEPKTWSADTAHKIIVFSESGPIPGSQKELSGHSDKLIEDMDAIYALP